MFHHKKIIILSLITSWITLFAFAENESATTKHILKNGDRITGQILSETEENIVILNDVLGEVTLPKSALLLSDPQENIVEKSPLAEAVEAKEVPSKLEKKQVLPFLDVPENWIGKFSIGSTWQTGRSEKTSWDLKGSLTVKEDKNEYQYSAFYRFEETDNSVSNDRWGLGFRYRRDLSPTTFIQSQTSYEVDRVKELDSHFIQSLGYGFRLVDREDFHVNLVPGIAFEYIDQRNVNSDTNFLFNLYQELLWNINERFDFVQNINFYLNPDNTDSYRFLFKAGIVGAITETVKMDISYEFEYDNTVASTISKEDSRLISAIVFAF